MAPRISLQPISRAAYECPQCRLTRSFANTSLRTQVGPESPRFIDVPEPPQQSVPDRQRIRGILPIPRDIFSGRTPGRGLDKADDANIARATRLPRAADGEIVDAGSRIAWKQRMAEVRRKNLQQGLQELRNRRIRSDRRMATRTKQRQDEREELLHRPEREDERLTTPSIDPVLQQVLAGRLQDPDREARLEMKRARVQNKENLRKEERQDALHTMYMEARDFITTEQQLDKAIDDAFTFDFGENATSHWNDGAPSTVQDLVEYSKGTKRNEGAVSSGKGYAGLTAQRIKRMAEELTGGKMDN